MFRKTFTVLAALILWSGHGFADSFTIEPGFLKDLREQRSLLGQKVKDLDEISKQTVVAQSDKRSALDLIRRLEEDSKQAKTRLEKLQEFDRDNPGTIPPSQLRSVEDQNRRAFEALKEARKQRASAENLLNSLNALASTNYADFLRLQKSFERDIERVVDARSQEHLRGLQVKKEVTVTEKVACGEDSIPVCKERSKKAAELKASERGSVVFVNSLTEVKNFKLSKEVLRSEVQATLSDKVFSNQHMVGETEYETTITAKVEPVIGDALHAQIAGAIRPQVYDMVGGKMDFSRVQKPSQFTEESREADNVASGKPNNKKRIKPVQTEVAEQQEEPAKPLSRPAPSQPEPVQRKIEKPIFTF